MDALRPTCPVYGHRVLIWLQGSNIDRKINKCWLRTVFRNVLFDLRFSLSSTVDIDSSRELECSDTYRVIFLLITHSINFPTLRLDLRLSRDSSLSNVFSNHIPDNIPTYTWLLTPNFHIEKPQNETDRLNTWADRLNRWVWPTGQLTGHLTDIPQKVPNITMYRFQYKFVKS